MSKYLLLLLIMTISTVTYALSEKESRHLLARTNERISEENIAVLLKLDREKAFDWIMRNHTEASSFKLSSSWLNDYYAFYNFYQGFHQKKDSQKYLKELSRKSLVLQEHLHKEGFGGKKMKFSPLNAQSLENEAEKIIMISFYVLQMKWFKHMIETNSPITEMMALFWHNHFTTSYPKVPFPDLVISQNHLLRSKGLGNFKDLLEMVTLDEAMLTYLDGKDNVKGKPNQNYARELLELFTIGEGNYTENDVRELSRSLTGIRLGKGQGKFDPYYHDEGKKKLLGHEGNLNYQDVHRILLNHPNTSKNIVKKFWKNFISPNPKDELVTKWAAEFKQDYDLMKLLRKMLTSDEFYNKENSMTLIKSPIDWMLSIFSFYHSTPIDYVAIRHQTRILGQELLNPPDVRGWLGGQNWITVSTWVVRQKYVNVWMNPKTSNGIKESSLNEWKKQFGKTPWRDRASFFLTDTISSSNSGVSDRDFLIELMRSPRFSLK